MATARSLASWGFARAVAGAFLIHLTLGTFYCWGNITPYVTSYLLWQGHHVDYTGTSFVFACAGFCLGSLMALGGLLQARVGRRAAALVGGWTLSTGVFLSFFTVQQGLAPFVATYSVLFGLGVALAYTAPIQCLMQWLPERKGLASGLVVLGFGLGAFVFDPLQAAEVNPRNLAPTWVRVDGAYFDWHDLGVQSHVLAHVPGLFLRLAAIYAIIQLVGAALLSDPPGSGDSGGAAGAAAALLQKPPLAKQYTVGEMLRTRAYWLLATNFFCNTQAVFFGASFSKTIAGSIIPGAATDATLTYFAAVSGLFNAAGRVVWGTAGDKCGFRCAMLTLCALQATLFFTLPLCLGASMYCVWLCGIMFCVGGNFSLFPAACASYFGEVNLGSNYGFIYLAQSFSMLLAPTIAREVLERYSAVALCRAVCAFSLAGAVSAWLNRPPLSSAQDALE